ncbi:MAG: hypothetical protein PUD63_05135 [Clostridia bacterium]|nr:hypothetical protein [Clostridia bacterium]
MKKWIALLLILFGLLPTGALAQEALSIYQATVRTQQDASFFDRVDPAWFHQSGEISYRNGSKKGRYDLFAFGDQAKLTVDQDAVFYEEYDGQYRMIYGEDPQHPSELFPRPSFAVETGYLAANALFDARLSGGEPPVLEQEELSGITLAQADAAVIALLDKLELSGYELSTAVDMSVERIREWGVRQVAEQQAGYNIYDRYYDFSQATEADEGYYLVYRPVRNGLTIARPEGEEGVRAFVTAKGVVSFQLRNSYVPGEECGVCEKPLTEDEIRTFFEKDHPRRISDGFLDPVFENATLMYCPMRAPNPRDGMILAPAWYIEYTFTDGSRCDGWAWYSAVDGKLIMDCIS